MAVTTSKTPTEFNTITSQPLLNSANAPIMTENINETNSIINMPISANMEMTNTIISQPLGEADAITTQPMLNPGGEEKEKKFSQFNPTIVQVQQIAQEEKTRDDCWLCIACTDCINYLSDCDFCCWLECCGSCCENCCEDGPPVDGAGLDGGDVADCCGACFECCSD